VVSREGIAAGASPAGIGTDLDRGFAVDAHAQDGPVIVSGLVVGGNVVEDRIGLREFFWGLALSTGRSR